MSVKKSFLDLACDVGRMNAGKFFGFDDSTAVGMYVRHLPFILFGDIG